jgi:hypothetical protein
VCVCVCVCVQYQGGGQVPLSLPGGALPQSAAAPGAAASRLSEGVERLPAVGPARVHACTRTHVHTNVVQAFQSHARVPMGVMWMQSSTFYGIQIMRSLAFS